MANYFERYLSDEEKKRWASDSPNFQHFDQVAGVDHPGGGKLPTDPRTPDTSAITRGYSIGNPAPMSIWDRIKEDAGDVAEHYSPVALISRYISGLTPNAEDYRPNDTRTPDQVKAERQARIAADEREFRAQDQLKHEGDPALRQDGSFLGNAARFGARGVGQFAGGMISDPTNIIAPGETWIMKMLGQAGIGAGVDALMQGGEMKQGVRDEYSPLETGISAAAGPAMVGTAELAHRLPGTASALRDWWHGRGVDTTHLNDADLVSGSLDGGVDPNVRMGPQDIQEVLQRAGASPDQFSSPEMAARAAGRVQDITPPLNTDPAELARQAALRGDIEAGTTDPSFAPQPPPRVMPDDVPIISAPGGLNARADDLGAMQGFDRTRFADAAALARGRIAGEQDPTMHAILNDPSANQQQKIASIWDRLQRQAQSDQAGVDQALTLPEQPLTPWQASTPDRAIGEGVGAGLPRMVDITRATESGGHRYGPDGQLLRSPKGALGEMQVMPGTNRDPGFGVRAAQNTSPEELARVGRDYLKAMQDRYGGDPAKAWAAYNAGPGAVDKALRHGDEWLSHLPAETQAYVSKNMKQLGAAPPPYRMAAPDGDTIHGQYSSPDRVQRNYDDPKAGPVREDFQGFEKTEKPASPTNEQLAGGDIYRRRGSEIFNDDRRGQAFEPRTQTGDSTRPFKAVADDPEGQPGYWEQRAQGMHEEAFAKAQADLEQEWARRAEAAAERASRTSGKTRFEEERTAEPDPASRYGSSGYGQKPFQDGGTWRTTAEGHIADKDGKPVAFRNAKEAATWAARNQMGGDFELGSWGTNSKRIVLKRRANSAYGSAPERPTPGAGPVDPPAGRSADPSQRALGAPESAPEPPTHSGRSEAEIAAERPAGGQEAGFSPPPPPEPKPRPEIPPETRAPIAGKSEQVVTPRGRSVDTQFEVREARDLVSSDHPAYDPALQPRDRANRSSSDAQVAEIASKLDPEQLHSSRLASQGAPIVGPDRMVESGNGRVQAIRRAYDQHPEKMDAYKGMIRDQGLDPSGFDQPVLVRRRTTDLGGEDRGAFVREANERDTMQMSSPEQAKADAGALTDDVLSLHRGGAVTDAGNRDFVRAWVDKVASPAERNTLMQADGSLSQDGIRRVRSSLLAKAYDDADLVSRITEDPDTNIKAIGSALTDTAPGFAQLRQKVAAGDLPKEFDIGKNVGEMASMISRARSEGKPLADMVKQDDIFAGRTDPTTEALTRLMFKGEDLRQPRSAADMQEGLRFYTQEAAKAKSGSLFGDDAPAAKPLDILKAAAAKLDKKAADRSGKGATLFRRAAETFRDDKPTTRRMSEDLRRVADTHENVQMRSLAGRLADLVGDSEVRYGDVDHEGLKPGEVAKGRTDAYSDGRIETAVHSSDDPETLTHEAIHVATLSRYGQLVDEAGEGTPAEGPIAEIEQLRQRAQKAFDRRPDDPTGEIRNGLENTDEFLAHGLTSKAFQGFLQRHSTANLWGRFRDWVRGLLGIDPKADTILDRTLQAGSRLMKAMDETPAKTGEDRASLFSKAASEDEGTPKPDRKGFGRIADAVVDLDGLKGDAAAVRRAIGKPLDAVKSFTEPMGRMVSAAFYSNDARLRGLAGRFKSDALQEYADLWHSRAGKGDATSRTYHEAVARQSTTRTQRAYEALEPFLGNKAATSRIKDLLTHPNQTMRATAAEREAAGSLRSLLKETIAYRKKAGEDIGEVSDGYFPRILNVEKVVRNKDAFLRAAEQLYRNAGADDPKEAAGRWLAHVYDTYAGLDGGLGFVRSSAGGLGSNTAKAREFGKQADTLLKDYYDGDVFHVMAAYFTGAAKRAEYARRFGLPGEAGSAERHAWLEKNGEKSQFDVLMNRIKEDVRGSGEKPNGVLQVLDSVHRSNLGQMGSADPFTRTATSYLHTWNQLAKMDRTLVTSLGELTMGLIRGGPKYGFGYLKDTAQEFVRQLRKVPPSDAQRWAEAIGVANDAMVNQVLTSRISAEHSTAGAQKIMAGFYRAIGLHQFTEAERIAGAKMGRKMLDVFAHDLTSDSARVRSRAGLYLRELGIQDVDAFGKRLRDGGFDREDVLRDDGPGAEYGTALLRLVNQTVITPSRAEKPTWAAHPFGSLVFSLSGYSYGFKKNVLDRAGRLAIEGVKNRDPKLLVPAFSLSVMAAFQALNDTYIRPALFGSGYDFSKETPTEMMVRVADRAGFTGGFSPILNAVKGVRYNRSLAESISGPALGSAVSAAQKIFIEPFNDKNSPNTNTAERNAAAAFYDTVVDPMIDGFAAARLKGFARTAAILGKDASFGRKKPAAKEEFVDEVGGEKPDEDGDE